MEKLEKHAYHEGHLKQATQLILILGTRLGMYKTTLVTNDTITADKHVVCNRLSEYLNLQNICNYLLRFPIDIGMDQSNVVIASDDISEGR